MRLAITGGSGFIASHIVDRLLPLGVELVLVDVRPPEHRPSDAVFRRADVRDTDPLVEALRGVDAVLHLAAAHRDTGISRDEYFSVNEGGARALADAMSANGITSLCNYSSVAVYGQHAAPPDENTPPCPATPYGESKLAAEQVLRAWAHGDPARRCLNLRPTVTYGPRNRANMYSLIDHLHRRRFWPVGNGRNRKSIAYVENIVAATLHLWPMVDDRVTFAPPGRRVQPPTREPFETFNYVDTPDLTSREIVAACSAALGRWAPRPAIPLWVGVLLAMPFDVAGAVLGREFAISSKRVRKLATNTQFAAERIRAWGFVSPVDAREGLRRMARWYLERDARPALAAARPEPAATSAA